MRLLCPHCSQAITVADTEAGKEIDCPLCKQRFAAPQLYTAPAPYAALPAPTLPAASSPSVPQPSPATSPSAPTPTPTVTATAPTTTAAASPTVATTQPMVTEATVGAGTSASPKARRGLWIAICPDVLAWVAPVALLVAFILSFWSWAGMYPGGYPAYTQNAWLALFASVSVDPVAEDELKLLNDIKDRLHSSWWLLPYLPMLLLAVVAAWAGTIVTRLKLPLPARAQSLWQYRSAAIGVLSVLMLFFVLAQWSAGLGLQRAMRDRVEADHEKTKADANTPEKMQRWEMKVAMHQGAVHVRTTTWLRLVILVHAIAALAIVLEAWMMLRGDQPPPRIGIEW